MDHNKDNAHTSKKTLPPGILRLDFGKPRCLTAEFKFHQEGEPTSPQPSDDRLSVTFADESVKSDSSTKVNYFNPLSFTMDVINTDGEDSDQEDYSASANVIMQRKASTRKSKRKNRRASSPYSPDVLPNADNGPRRSSVFTNSSGELIGRKKPPKRRRKTQLMMLEIDFSTAITMDENLVAEATQEEIFENIKLHKEVLSNVRMQPWNMRKKIKLVIQAKAYIKKHEGVLQERLAQSHSTRDLLARWHILLIKKWQKFRREMLNLSMWFIPWELKIKEIESHFGSVVASYFIFLRWLLWVNVVVSVALISFVTIPEYLIANPLDFQDRKVILEEEKYNATNFMTLWEFDGLLKYTPLFYGWYSSGSSGGYKMPIAYFVTGLVVYGYSFFATLKKMAENSRMSKLSEKDDECIFTWKVFTAWDYMIGNAETAHNRVASIVMGFKEALLEEAEKKKDTETWRIVSFRVLVNVIVIALLTLSMYIVVLVVKRSTDPEAESTFWRKNEIAIVISILTFIFPMIFEVLGIFEQYHPRKQLRLQLGRIMILNLGNLYSLIFALIGKIGDMTEELQMFKNTTWTECRLDCIDSYSFPDSDNQIMEVITNVSTKILSNITSYFNESESELVFLNNSLINFLSNTINTTIDNITYIYEDLDVTDLESKFADYLTYLLYSFQDNTNSTPIDFENLTESFTTSTNVVPTTYWEEISSTILPLLMNITDRIDEGRFDYDISTIFNNSSTSVTTDYETSTSSIGYSNCTKICDDLGIENLETGMNYTMKARFRNLCWETMFGQELMSITVMDLIMTIVPSLGMDFFRGIFVRVMNRCWCWDLEKKFPKYGDFKVAENILSLVNNQGMVWMGMFFCPGLVVFNVIKLYITMYFKGWAVMTCNVPPEVIFRASRSNNFYYALLLAMLFLCVLPVGFTIVWIQPSWHCGPFSKYHRIFHIFTNTIRDNVPEPVRRALDYIASPGIVIPLLVLLILIIYYLMSLTNSLREANEDLKIQLRRERTEERRKMFQLADRRRRGGSGESNELSNTPFNKWKKLMGNLPSGKSLDETPKQEDVQKEGKPENKSKDFFHKLIKRALRKSSTSDDADDGTDTEQHDSLPYDTVAAKPIKSSFSWGSADFQNVALKARQLKKSKPETQVHHEETVDQKHVHINEKPVLSEKSNEYHEPSTSKGLRHSFGFNRHINIKDVIHLNSEPFTPITEVSITDIDTNLRESIENQTVANGVRQDSDSSVWSDGIPMITISKTESNENILSVINEPISYEDISTSSNLFTKQQIGDKTEENNDEIVIKDDVPVPNANIFKPKIKCVLKKQTTEIDEDTIRYFNDDIEKSISVNDKLRAIVDRDFEDTGLSPDDDILTDKSSSDTDQKESSVDTVLQISLT